MRGRAAGRAYVVNLDRNLLLRLLVQPFLDGGLGAQGDHVFDLPPTPRASGCCVRALITGPATYLVRLADLLLAEQLLPHLLFGGRHRAALEGRAPAHCQLQVLGLPLLWPRIVVVMSPCGAKGADTRKMQTRKDQPLAR